MRHSCNILLYHRVTELDSDRFDLAVSQENFNAQIQYISEKKIPIGLMELVQRITAGKSIDNLVCVTFDDGYSDNYENALPILEYWNVPATVFITSSAIESKEEFWWDLLEKVFYENACNLDSLRYKGNGLSINCNFTKRNWKSIFSKHFDLRTDAFNRLHTQLLGCSLETKKEVISRLIEERGMSLDQRVTHRTLSSKQFEKLSNSPLIEVGNHTANHPMLSMCSEEVIVDEVLSCNQLIKKITGCSPRIFSLPHGKQNKTVIETVKNTGMEVICTSVQRPVREDDLPDFLPRRVVHNIAENEFSKWLEK